MTCYRPISACQREDGSISFRKGDGRALQLPCGKCQGCLARRAQDWAVRVMHEAQMWPANCFVTLTYGRDKLPAGGSLEYRDFQLFMKRLRQWRQRGEIRDPVRFFMCGEYGPLNLRPHYHACLFNVDFNDKVVAGRSAAGAVFFDSPTLAKLWGHGKVTVQELNHATAFYCAKYVMKVEEDPDRAYTYRDISVDGDGVFTPRCREFSHSSLKPGIGAEWYRRYGGDVYPGDFVVADGRKFRPPRYYDRIKKRDKSSVVWDEIEFERYKRSLRTLADSSPERLAVRELVHKARVRNQRRVLDE